MLREDYIEPLGLTQGALADTLDVDRSTVNEIVDGKRSITPEMAKAEVERLPVLV